MTVGLGLVLRAQGRGFVGAGVALLVSALTLGSSVTSVYGMASGTGFTPCLPGTGGAVVHYSVGDTPGALSGISGMTIDGLSGAGCQGSSVSVTLQGNDAGDTAAEPTRTLSTFDSAVDPCSGGVLAVPGVVALGRISLTGCSARGPGGYADLHDLTRLVLRVAGDAVPVDVSGTTDDPAVLGGGRAGPRRIGSLAPLTSLPFTGSWAAFTFWCGTLGLLLGGLLLRAGRRTRHAVHAEPA